MHPCKALLFFLLSPLFIVVGVIGLVLWLVCTCSCIGPILQACCSACDESLLEKPPKGITHVMTPRGYKLAVRFSGKGAGGGTDNEKTAILSETTPMYENLRRYPVVIPNGLAATMATIGKMHDELVRVGFTVLSFDRLGVGFSDVNKDGNPPTVQDCVADCLLVMDKMLPDAKWLMLGPSMGAIVAQCFIAQHPDKVVGFLNMDGLPHPFSRQDIRKKFIDYRGIYNCWANCTWTGMMRPFLCCAGMSTFSNFATNMFPVSIIKAQMNQSNFWRNTGLEFPLMMDCAAGASDAWGPHSVLSLSPDEVTLLARVEPVYNGEYRDGQWVKMDRAVCELAPGYASDEETKAIIQTLKAKGSSPLSAAWEKLAVRVMQARAYDPVGYDEEMKKMGAAEGCLHAVMAADGARYTFPHLTHGEMFRQVSAIVLLMIELDNAAARLQQQQNQAVTMHT